MTEPVTTLSTTAAMLRSEFDRSFAEAPKAEPARLENLLAVRIGGDAYAMRLEQIGGLYVDRRVVPFPTPIPDLLGVASFRGQLAPVYDLAALLGYAPRTSTRWLVLARGEHTVALGFDLFEAQRVVAPERIVAAGGAGAEREPRPHLRGAVQLDGAVRPIVDLPSVLDDIKKRVDVTHLSTKER